MMFYLISTVFAATDTQYDNILGAGTVQPDAIPVEPRCSSGTYTSNIANNVQAW